MPVLSNFVSDYIGIYFITNNKHPNLISINKELELLKANELLTSIMKQLQTNDRIFVHAPFKLIKSIEKSTPVFYKDYNSGLE